MNRSKIIKWAAAAIGILVLASAAAIFVAVRTESFRRYVLNQVIEKARDNLGARLEVGRIAINWRPLQFDFYGVTLHGKELDSQPPLLAADHVRVGLSIVSFLRAQVNLRELVVDRPAVHLSVDAQGNSNFPQAPAAAPGNSSTQASVDSFLNMAVQRLNIESGSLFYNDQEIPLSADLREFRAQMAFNHLASEYRGTLGYGQGAIAIQDFRPVAHGMLAAFTVSRSGMAVDPVLISTAESKITAHVKLPNYEHLQLTGDYKGELSTTEILRIANSQPAADGVFSLAGEFTYTYDPKKSWLESAEVAGKLTSAQIRAAFASERVTATAINGEYQLRSGELHVKNVQGNALGGRIAANYDLLSVHGGYESRLNSSIQDASLAEMNSVAPTPNLKTVKLVGRVDGTVQAVWRSQIRDAKARIHMTIRNPGGQPANRGAIALAGLIDVDYDGARQTASFGNSHLTAGGTTASVNGILSKSSRLNAQLISSDLRELAALAAAFGVDTGALGDASPLRDLAGSARFDGQILGAPSDPGIQGRLVASNLQIRNTRWRTLQVSVDASAKSVSLRNGTATDSQNGQIGFRLDAPLNRWSFNRSAALSAQLTAKEISVEEVQRIANSSYPVSGSITADISLQGSADHPNGQGTLTIARAKAWDEDINSFTANFSGDGNAIWSNIQMATAAGSATANVDYQPATQTYDVDMKSAGVKLENLRTAQIQSLGVSGDVAFAASGHGTVSNPQLAATLQIPQLRFRDWVVSDVQASLNSADQHATFTLSTRADQASIQARGEVALSGNYPATASLEVRAMPVALVLAKYLRADQSVQGETDLQATFSGPLKNPDAVTAQMEISKLNLAYQSANLALIPPLRLKYSNGLATLDRAEFKGTGTNVTIAGAIPIKSAQPLDVSADGSLDLALLQGWESDLRSSGKLTVNLSARGALTHPSLQGQIHLADARLATESIPIGLDGINGVFQFAGNRIDITQFSGSAGGGTVSAHGFMTYGDPSSINVGLDLKSVRVRYPEGIRSIVSGNLALNGAQSASRLTGRLLVDRLSFTQQFDLANFLGQFGADTGPTASSSLAQNMALNVSVATGQEERLSNSKVNVEGSANLTLIGTAAYPVILGRTALTGGELFFMGKRYEIQNGTIEFANPVRTTPVLNLNVSTTVQQYNIGLNFVGPLNKLRTNYTSDPPLPSADIIHLVAFGKTSEQSATSPSTPAALGAQSVLAQGVSGQISNKLEQLTGISQLTIDPLSNNQTNPGSQVAIQQHITGNLLLTFSTDVTSTQNQSIQVQYRAKKNLSISALRDQYGGYAADVRIHKTF